MAHRDTDAVHAGARRDDRHGAVAEPLVLSSTFDYPERIDGTPSPYIYTRYANPTIEATERRLAALEGTSDAVLFASGMAAIGAALQSLLETGDTFLTTPQLYGGTDQLFQRALPRNGIRSRPLTEDMLTDPDRIAGAVRDTDRLLYIESPTNPMLRVLDVPALVAAAHDAGLKVVLDNTFAGPTVARPARWGVDLVCESATKSLGGHSDLIAGVVAGTAESLEAVRENRRIWGSCLDPSAAYRLLRGLQTLPLRTRQAGETAVALAERLQNASWCRAVHQPALDTHPDHDVARRTLEGPIALVTLVLADGEAAARRLRQNVRLVRPAASLGGVETLLSLPSETSHAHLAPTARQELGIPPGTVRLAVGLEHVDDLEADLVRAISAPERESPVAPKSEPL